MPVPRTRSGVVATIHVFPSLPSPARGWLGTGKVVGEGQKDVDNLDKLGQDSERKRRVAQARMRVRHEKALAKGIIRQLKVRRPFWPRGSPCRRILEHDPEKWARFSEKIMLQQ